MHTHLLSKILILVMLFMVVFSPMTVLGQGDDGLISVDFDPETPIIEHWEDPLMDAGAVIYHDERFHMFTNSTTAFGEPANINYFTSEDGVEWTRQSDEPIFSGDNVPFDVSMALVSSVLIEKEGTWVLYFYLFALPTDSVQGGIARATADDPLGEWIMDDTLALELGSNGAWDDELMTSPSVVKTDEGYFMYYSGHSALGWSIGLATSENGVTWVKYDDPETTDAIFAESDPIFTYEDSVDFEAGPLRDYPHVLLTSEGWIMLFMAAGAGDASQVGYGIAISDDGMAWELLSTEAIISAEATTPKQLLYPTVAYVDDVFYVFVELNRSGLQETDVYLATFEMEVIK